MTLTLAPVSSWTFTTLPSILRFSDRSLVATELNEVMYPIKNSSSLHSSRQFTSFLSAWVFRQAKTGKMLQLVTLRIFLSLSWACAFFMLIATSTTIFSKLLFNRVFFPLSSHYLCLDFLLPWFATELVIFLQLGHCQ